MKSKHLVYILIGVLVAVAIYGTFFLDPDSPEPVPDQLAFVECNSAYLLSESFFDTDQELEMNVRVVYFANEKNVPINKGLVERRIAALNDNFRDSGANIVFSLKETVNILGTPSQGNEKYGIPPIRKVERYDIQDYKIYDYYLSDRNALTFYVFHEPGFTHFAGEAAGAPSTFLCIREDFFFSDDPTTHSIEFDHIKTLGHEIGHTLGLLHTHTYDPTRGYSSLSGDRICDLPYFTSMLGKVDVVCQFLGTNDHSLTDEEIEALKENFMSYSMPCRQRFSEGQVKRMRWMIEQSQDLRSTLKYDNSPDNTYEMVTKFLNKNG